MALTGMLNVATLVIVQGGLRLTAGAAASWVALADEVQRRFGWRPVLTDAYRDYAAQVAVFTARYERRATGTGPYGDVRWWEGRRYVRVRGAAAAVPGTSNHGTGYAVDVTGLDRFTSQRFKEFADVAQVHGWSNVEGRTVDEPWHWVKTGPGKTTTSPQGDDMPSLEEVQQMIVGVMRSTEFDLSWGRATEVVSGWYIDLLGRPGSPAEVKSHAGRITSSAATYADIYAAIYATDEAKAYRARLATVGTAPAIDYAALAKAVNDDAARRLAS